MTPCACSLLFKASVELIQRMSCRLEIHAADLACVCKAQGCGVVLWPLHLSEHKEQLRVVPQLGSPVHASHVFFMHTERTAAAGGPEFSDKAAPPVAQSRLRPRPTQWASLRQDAQPSSTLRSFPLNGNSLFFFF